MPLVLVENFEEFCAKQECDFVRFEFGKFTPGKQRVLFRNGAEWNGPHGNTAPPTDPGALAQLKLEFISVKLNDARQEYKNFHEAVDLQASYLKSGVGPHPDQQWPGWRDHLKKLARDIETLQNEERTLATALPKNIRAIEYERQRNERREQAYEVVTALRDFPNSF